MSDAAGMGRTGLTIRSVRTRGVKVPLTFPLGTSAATVREAPLLLVDLAIEEGVVGRSYLFGYTPGGARAMAVLLEEVVALVAGQDAAPRTIALVLGRRLALLGVAGPVRMALAALDVALWDALAIARGVPLATLLGARPGPVRAYNSSGLGLMPAEAAAEEAVKLLARGFGAVKLRLGHPTLQQDLRVARAVRRRLPDDVAMMVDYNQALSVAEAIRRGRALEQEGAYWLEEPVRHGDLRGQAAIARALALPLQAGENFDGPAALQAALAAEACDYVMPDLARIGGVTGWIEAAGIAAAQGVEMSSHLFPEVSAHLLAATPTAHWLEYVDWADAILEQPLEIRDGQAIIPDRPGHGMSWDEGRLARLPGIG
ncbi:enolase C-terminal domain-like protein [Falsiroseomonas oryzae]|uniref:enolase C-terminal domain-like protein n=1 Tax=Falsiroseomonas oryzae TaxID=2766473 RepID=UPI0022EA8C1A|nr:enolase C-terminal domain-like protein [Roseomonas sp. MO-31]